MSANQARLNRSDAKWWLCLICSVAITVMALIPQFHLWYISGGNWHGSYASLQGDEFLYSAYVNALIDGRPRKNDPFAGQDDRTGAQLPESSFSIQFIPAYTLALPARLFGLSASTVFILLEGLTAFFSSFLIFWLCFAVTRDERFSAAGTFVILCLGELAGDQGILGVLVLGNKLSVLLPFLRRYQPAAVFPTFVLFCLLIWRGFTSKKETTARAYASLAAAVFAVLVFSYLYFWTAAAAWLACIAGLWIWFRPEEWRRVLAVAGIVGLVGAVALAFYLRLVSRRSTSIDDAQILVFTHWPDLAHTPEIIGALILVVIIVGSLKGWLSRNDPAVLFTMSFAVVPFVIFNQQILTGRSMQPFHYDLFVANYGTLLALVILAKILRPNVKSRLLIWISISCLLCGYSEVSLLSRARNFQTREEDQAVPVFLRLKELSKQDGTALIPRASNAVVFSPHADILRLLPTWTTQGTILTAGAQDFGTASRFQRKETLFLQLYLSQVDPAQFKKLLNQTTDDLYMNFFVPSVIFGDERFIPELTLHFNPITTEEIDTEVTKYQHYLNSISRDKVMVRPLTYVIVKNNEDSRLTVIDRWYERTSTERISNYALIRVKPRE